MSAAGRELAGTARAWTAGWICGAVLGTAIVMFAWRSIVPVSDVHKWCDIKTDVAQRQRDAARADGDRLRGWLNKRLAPMDVPMYAVARWAEDDQAARPVEEINPSGPGERDEPERRVAGRVAGTLEASYLRVVLVDHPAAQPIRHARPEEQEVLRIAIDEARPGEVAVWRWPEPPWSVTPTIEGDREDRR